MRLADGSRRAVCEVFAVDTSLSDDEESEEIAEAFAAFLNTLRYPIQLSVRAAPFDTANTSTLSAPFDSPMLAGALGRLLLGDTVDRDLAGVEQ